MAETCPLLKLQPVLQGTVVQPPGAKDPIVMGATDVRTTQRNNELIEAWTRRMCAYVDQLKARIEILEAGP